MEDIQAIRHKLEQSKKVFITTHQKPDGDALGSSLALWYYLKKKGKEAIVVSPTDFGEYLAWMPGADKVLNDQLKHKQALKHLKESDLIFCLDFNTLNRINSLEQPVRESQAVKVLVDHHLEPEGFEDFRFWNPKACATSEIMYELISALGDESLIDAEIGTCLYTGIMTDTGSFQYSSTSARVHEIIASLIQKGVQNSRIHELIYDTYSPNRLKFFGHCLCDRLVYLPEYRTAYIAVSREELKKYQIGTGDTEGLVNYPLSIQDVVLAALIIDRKEIRKISLRSKGTFPANEIASRIFEGGGHLNAAGGKSNEPLEAVVEKFRAILPEYKDLLLKQQTNQTL